jgi:redox-sensitive bicupin YhaK (pirin superfamily)
MIDLVIPSRPRDLGGVTVGRVLPSMQRRLVGPFIFFDHMGPEEIAPGAGVDVRPHPHINLATVTYLFEGELLHRDSLGSAQVIRPGAINWMSAGRGIAHSERTPPELRPGGSRLHGLQLWVALPAAAEETDPTFHHHPAESLPEVDVDGSRARVLAGSAYGATAPVRTASPLHYVEVHLGPGGRLPLPPAAEHEERAVYVAAGELALGEHPLSARQLAVLEPGAEGVATSAAGAHVMLLGGARLDGPRHIWWNFVSSSKERIEDAKRAWKEDRFPRIPGDDVERIPLPE